MRSGDARLPSSWRKTLGGGAAEGGGVLGDDGDAGLEEVGELDVVEADEGDGPAALGDDTDDRDGDAVVAGEDRGDGGGTGQHVLGRLAHPLRVGDAQDIQSLLLDRYARLLHGRPVAAQPFGGAWIRGMSPMKPIRRWPWAIRWATPSRAPPKLSDSTTSASICPAAVHEHRGDARLDLGLQIGGRHRPESAPPPMRRAHRARTSSFAVRVLGAGAVDEQRAVVRATSSTAPGGP